MFPNSGQSSLEIQTTLKKFKPLELITSHPCIFFFISILFIQFIVILFHRSPLVTSTVGRQVIPPPITDECDSGRIYVYELPPMFNSELVDNCNDLDQWHWQCGVATNGGYGSVATELAGVVPEGLAPAFHRTNQFSSEIIFHNRILKHKCRTLEAESATAFYVPFYAGLAVGKYLFSSHTDEERDFDCKMLIKWVQAQPHWKRTNGSDHFIVLGRITWDFRRLTDPEKLWGSSFLNMPEIYNLTRLTIERAPYDHHDIGVPYPTGFHPRSDTDILTWQSFVRTRRRTSLFSFVGAAREDTNGDIRGLLLRTCRSVPGACKLVDCSVTQCANGSSAIMETLLDSEFCLQPRGDSFTRRSVFDCMVAGSVPVFFWTRTAYDQYEWFLPDLPESYSVFIDHDEVQKGSSIKDVLEKYSGEEVRRMREKVIECIPKIVYGEGDSGIEDAFEIAVDGVLMRFKEETRQRMNVISGMQ